MFELSEKNVKNDITMSEGLKKVKKKINAFQQIAKNSIYAISLILSDIADKPKEYFENSKYATIADYAEEMFAYKKSYTYKLIRIARFIKIKSKDNEIIDVKSLIDDKIEADYWFDIVKDADGFEFSPSQLLELIPLTKEQIEENITILDSSLTCKELRSIVKDIVNPPIETKGEESKNESNNEEQEENKEEEKTPLTDKDRILQMLEICSNMEDEGIKEKIVNVFQKSLKALEK